MSDFFTEDINELLGDSKAQVKESSSEQNAKLNALLVEHDRELVNTWHVQRHKRVWPKGIGK